LEKAVVQLPAHLEEAIMGKRAKIEEAQLPQSQLDLIGCAVRIEVELTSAITARDHIRKIMTVLEQADFMLSHFIENPPTPPLKGKMLEHHVLMAVKSLIRSAQRMMPTRKRGRYVE